MQFGPWLALGGETNQEGCGSLAASVFASKSPTPGSNLGPGGLPTGWFEGREIVL